MKTRRHTAGKSKGQQPRVRAHEEYPPGTPVPRDVLQVRLRDLHEVVARLERPAFGQASTVMLGAIAVIVTADVAILAATEGPLLWLLLLAVLLVVLAMGGVASRYLDRSGPDDDRRAELLGDIAYLESADVTERSPLSPSHLSLLRDGPPCVTNRVTLEVLFRPSPGPRSPRITSPGTG